MATFLKPFRPSPDQTSEDEENRDRKHAIAEFVSNTVLLLLVVAILVMVGRLIAVLLHV